MPRGTWCSYQASRATSGRRRSLSSWRGPASGIQHGEPHRQVAYHGYVLQRGACLVLVNFFSPDGSRDIASWHEASRGHRTRNAHACLRLQVSSLQDDIRTYNDNVSRI